MPQSERRDAAAVTARLDRETRSKVYALRFIIDNARRNSIAVVVVVAALASIVGPYVGWLPFLVWGGLVLVAYGVRVMILAPALHADVLSRGTRSWTGIMYGSTLLSGAVGASAPLLFFPSLPPFEQSLTTLVLCCWVTGAMASIGAMPMLFAFYVLVFMAPLIGAWSLTGAPHMVNVTLPLAAYGVIVAAFGRTFARQIEAVLEVRFQNEDLVAQLEVARQEAETANIAKSRFLAVASHDLRQPLHALTILSGLLRRPVPPERIAEIGQQIVRSVGSLERLFSALLDISRLEIGAVRPDPRPTALSPLIEQLATEYSPRAQAKGLHLDIGSCEMSITTDPVLLERILRNLIDNAVKYTECGRVAVCCARESGTVVISVSDTGQGIRPEDTQAVFEEYFQAGTAQPHRDRGLGLGLAIVRRLSDLLGYRIELESAVGSGSTFKLTIPSASTAAEQEVPAAEAHDLLGVNLKGLRIVLVDDDVLVHGAMRLLFEDWRCDAVIASTLEEARATLHARGMRPEAILADYNLADGVTGVEVIEALRDEYGPLPAAIITGEMSAGSRAQLTDLEYPVLFKPVQPEDLRKLLQLFRTIE